MTPTIFPVTWTLMQAARSKPSISLPQGRRGVRIRRVLAGGLMLALADESFFEPPTPAAIPFDDEEKPMGLYLVEFDGRGFFTDRILRLQDRSRVAINRGETP